jgi:phosphatidylserine/phosphatidylglycerophosphate/cardiolipin synthase-like enzyme
MPQTASLGTVRVVSRNAGTQADQPMKPQQIRDMLAATLEDRRLSRGERSAVKRILEDLKPGDGQLANYRSIAFDLAREAVDATNASMVLGWLEEVMKALQPPSQSTSRGSEALFSPDDDCPQRIRGLLARSKQRIDICVFTITDDRLTSAIFDAHRRGVQIHIITDDDKTQDIGSDTQRLAAAGIEVRVDNSRYHMHHKFAMFDGATLLSGSYNWTRSAAENNEENFIITEEPRLVGKFADLFERLWQEFG